MLVTRRWWLPRAMVGWIALTGCGRVGRAPGESDSAAGSGSQPSAGAPGRVGAGTNEAGNGGSGSGDSGETGAPGLAEPAADITGRWALFVFEDPVGVQLVQSGTELSGEGCAGGTPPLGAACGPLQGSIEGSQARFWFSFEGLGTYLAEVTVSENRERMTGAFHAFGDVPWPTAWLRVPDGDATLPTEPLPPEPQALLGQYELTLSASPDGGSDYDFDHDYRFDFLRDGFATDLGSFWRTEWSFSAADASFEVGPVPATAPQLATWLSIDTVAGGISRVRARTAAGDTYEFSATRK